MMSRTWPTHVGNDSFVCLRALRYGENPRQKNAGLLTPKSGANDYLSLSSLRLIEGTDPSLINYTDASRLIETTTRIGAVWEANFGFVPLIAIAVKHGNACGAAIGESANDVIQRMIEGNTLAISGGVVLTNFEVTNDHAHLLLTHGMNGGSRVLDSVITPRIEEAALKAFARPKTGKCRVFVNPHLDGRGVGLSGIADGLRYRQVRNEFLVQDGDPYVLVVPDQWKQNVAQIQDVVLGWAIGSTSNSNSIILVRDGMLLGTGLAQVSRVAACKVAVMNAVDAGHSTEGAVAYSDSFFPFRDGPDVLADAKVRTIFASSGSVRDTEVQKACAERGVTLLQLPDSEVRGFFGH